MLWLLWTYLVASCLIWCFFYWQSVVTFRTIRRLDTSRDQEIQNFPLLSVIIAARNEADTIRPALEQLLQQDYPHLEILIVNDRSTDDTGKIIDELAAEDPRVHTIHIDELPTHWLGKVHALHIASQQARGEWLLFTDADVHHSARLWRHAIEYAISNRLDHLAGIPATQTSGLWLQSTICTFSLLFLTSARADRIRDPDSPSAIGIGAFNLVRHNMLRKTPGFEWLRMEVADDYGLAIMIKSFGGKTDIVSASDDLHVTWYPTLGKMVRGLDKNIMSPGTHYRTQSLILKPLGMCTLILAPFISLLSYPAVTVMPGLFTLVIVSILSLFLAREKQQPITQWLLSPIGFVIITYIFCRACIMCLLRDGIVWRDTYYPRSLLQKYQRVRL